MGREQGDEAGTPKVFVRENPETGQQESREAFSVEDEVNLTARGWRPNGDPAHRVVAARGASSTVVSGNPTQADG